MSDNKNEISKIDAVNKGADEIFCHSCGGVVKKDAIMCVKCGVSLKKNSVSDPYISDKSCVAAFLLCTFLGVLGAHRFYVGKIGLGIFQLLTLGGVVYGR